MYSPLQSLAPHASLRPYNRLVSRPREPSPFVATILTSCSSAPCISRACCWRAKTPLCEHVSQHTEIAQSVAAQDATRRDTAVGAMTRYARALIDGNLAEVAIYAASGPGAVFKGTDSHGNRRVTGTLDLDPCLASRW